MLCWPSCVGPGYFLQQWVPAVRCYFLSCLLSTLISNISTPSFLHIFPKAKRLLTHQFLQSPILWKAIAYMHCSLCLGCLQICWCHIHGSASWETCWFSRQRMSCFGPSLCFREFPAVVQCLGGCWLCWAPLFACAGTLALVQLGQLICAYLPYCLLLSRHVSSNYTVLDGCQQEEDKMYSTAWDGTERWYSCVREDFILSF